MSLGGRLGIACAVMGAAVAFAAAAMGGTSPEVGLATLDCRCAPSSSQVAPYRAQMNRLAPKCRESREKLASFAWFIHTDLLKYGKHVSGLGGLKLLNKATPKLKFRQNCQSVTAALLVMIEG